MFEGDSTSDEFLFKSWRPVSDY